MTEANITASDFDSYFKEVHGSSPFPWQRRLVDYVTAEGSWPEQLDLPTGTGKTAAIDVALFHLALAPNRAPRRVVLVVDRRTVVEQAYERAERIQARLARSVDGTARRVAERLRALSATSNSARPFAIARLRGGMPRDDGWAKRPDEPLVAVSTVDQAGSRLLFRGYGVSDGMRPIHAGLLGNDTLFLLDEVHLSEPFRQTLEALRAYRATIRDQSSASSLPDRWQFVEMSATPGARTRTTFALDQGDRSDPVLARRLAAKKPYERRDPVKTSGNEGARRAAFAAACATEAIELATTGRVVGVVVNRVATAQAAHAEVAARLKRMQPGSRVLLVTGRMRPLDRDDLDEQLREFQSGKPRDRSAAPTVIVSTQCIEAGADLDFDALVTECAPLDSLRQRFGRLNRMGAIEDGRGIVLVRADALGKDPDPIYGSALAATWNALPELPSDFGIDAMGPKLAALAPARLAEMLSEKKDAPVMLPSHLDAWSQTKPKAEVDPDVSLWLHGIEGSTVPEVQVVWRADITEELLEAANDPERREQLVARIGACPPVGLEALTVPTYAVRSWLAGADDLGELADVEGLPEVEDERRSGPAGGKLALLWRGVDKEPLILDASDQAWSDRSLAGATILVPASRGGLAHNTWAPSSTDPVEDLGDRARWRQTARATLRLHPGVHSEWPNIPPLPARDDDEVDDAGALESWLAALPTHDGWRGEVLRALRAGRGKNRYKIVRHEDIRLPGTEAGTDPGYRTLIARKVSRLEARESGDGSSAVAASDTTTEGDEGSLTGTEVTLDAHMRGVEEWASRFAQGAGLPANIAADVALAARWHDAGKVDVRFQRMLYGGDAYRADRAEEPIAKSAMVAGDREARRRAQSLSGYPRGARHELASVALLEQSVLIRSAHDRDLVLHLVASHHGWCRPFAPVAPDTDPVELELRAGDEVLRARSDHGLERLDSGIADRFFRLVERYGWYGLAWLEAMLRLADHRRSELEQRESEDVDHG